MKDHNLKLPELLEKFHNFSINYWRTKGSHQPFQCKI